jgi:mono/diheme cytochrome c family protein
MNFVRFSLLAIVACVIFTACLVCTIWQPSQMAVQPGRTDFSPPYLAQAVEEEPEADPTLVETQRLALAWLNLLPDSARYYELNQAGKVLFDANCKQCHSVHEQVVGPALGGLRERRSVRWLVRFIRYPQRVIDSGDPAAVKLFADHNNMYMPNNDFPTEKEIKLILLYLETAPRYLPERSGEVVATAN